MSIRETLEKLGNEFGDRVYKDDGSMYAKAFRSLMGTILGWGYAGEFMRECRQRGWKYYSDMIYIIVQVPVYEEDISAKDLADYVGFALGYD